MNIMPHDSGLKTVPRALEALLPQNSRRSSEVDRLARPLVVDLDGTLIRTDILVESFFALLGRQPQTALLALRELRAGKAAFKTCLADQAVIELATLPFNEDVLAFVTAEKERGRPVYLASASDKRYVEALAEHLGLFDGVFGSEDGINLAGTRKAEMLCAAFGERGFDYVGDAAVDEAVRHGFPVANHYHRFASESRPAIQHAAHVVFSLDDIAVMLDTVDRRIAALEQGAEAAGSERDTGAARVDGIERLRTARERLAGYTRSLPPLAIEDVAA